MNLHSFGELYMALICNRCLRRLQIVINLRTNVRDLETLNVLYYLLLHRDDSFLCYDCYRLIQNLYMNYAIPISNNWLMYSPLIYAYMRALIRNHQQPAPKYLHYQPEPINRDRLQKSVIDITPINVKTSSLRRISTTTEQQRQHDTVKIIVNDIENIESNNAYPCKTESTSGSTYIIDFVPSNCPPPAYLAFADTESKRTSVSSTNSNELWAWNIRETHHEFYELRRSVARTNISIPKNIPLSQANVTTCNKSTQQHLKKDTTLWLEDVSENSEDATNNSECLKLNIGDLVGDSLAPHARICDWIATGERLEAESVYSCDFSPIRTQKMQSGNGDSSVDKSSQSSLEILFHCKKIQEFDSESTIDPVSEWLMQLQQPKTYRSTSDSTTSGLTERIMSYNDSPQSLSSFPLGQSDEELFVKEYKRLECASVSCTSTYKVATASVEDQVSRIDSPVPSTSTDYPRNESDIFTENSFGSSTITNSKCFSSSEMSTSSNSTPLTDSKPATL